MARIGCLKSETLGDQWWYEYTRADGADVYGWADTEEEARERVLEGGGAL